jgi:hypothetical protein
MSNIMSLRGELRKAKQYYKKKKSRRELAIIQSMMGKYDDIILNLEKLTREYPEINVEKIGDEQKGMISQIASDSMDLISSVMNNKKMIEKSGSKMFEDEEWSRILDLGQNLANINLTQQANKLQHSTHFELQEKTESNQSGVIEEVLKNKESAYQYARNVENFGNFINNLRSGPYFTPSIHSGEAIVAFLMLLPAMITFHMVFIVVAEIIQLGLGIKDADLEDIKGLKSDREDIFKSYNELESVLHTIERDKAFDPKILNEDAMESAYSSAMKLIKTLAVKIKGDKDTVAQDTESLPNSNFLVCYKNSQERKSKKQEIKRRENEIEEVLKIIDEMEKFAGKYAYDENKPFNSETKKELCKESYKISEKIPNNIETFKKIKPAREAMLGFSNQFYSGVNCKPADLEERYKKFKDELTSLVQLKNDFKREKEEISGFKEHHKSKHITKR